MALGAYFSNQGVSFAQSVGALGRVGQLQSFHDGSLGGVGLLTSYHDGSLGRTAPQQAYRDGSLGAPESTATSLLNGALVETWDSRPVLGNGNAQLVTVESETNSAPLRQAECMADCSRQAMGPQSLQSLQVKVGPSSSWHDGIFQADSDAGFGNLQASNSGSLGGDSMDGLHGNSMDGLGMPLYIDGREVTRPITIHHGPVSGCGVCGCDGCGCGGCDGASGVSGVDLSAYSNYFLYGGLALLGVGAFFMLKK